jgi:acyl-CoA synthetase (AMP-forming)/AMP-acid ligase II
MATEMWPEDSTLPRSAEGDRVPWPAWVSTNVPLRPISVNDVFLSGIWNSAWPPPPAPSSTIALSIGPDSSGVAVPVCDVIVVDKHDAEVPHGELGELCIRGSNLVQGY